MKTIKALETVKSIEAFQKLKELGGDISIVGGCVRDHFLNKESKDIDLIIREIELGDIINVLKHYGKVDQVGESFGIVKFSPFGWTSEPFDIAQPRKDVLIDKSLGHHGIKAMFDSKIPLIEDLNRRDFCLNSIAVSWDGTIVDPFNGLEDIKNKKIRATSKTAFIEDYLRAIRGIQFASRFDFEIESETLELIKQNRSDIKSISSERILEELEKIYYKGNIGYGIELLVSTGLHKEIFGSEISHNSNFDEYDIQTKSDFYYLLCKTENNLASFNYKNILKGEIKIEKGIKALEHLYTMNNNDVFEQRKCFYEAIQISDSILESQIIPSVFKSVQADFFYKKLPNSYKDLSINGDDLLAQGFKGAEIGLQLKEELFKELRTK